MSAPSALAHGEWLSMLTAQLNLWGKGSGAYGLIEAMLPCARGAVNGQHLNIRSHTLISFGATSRPELLTAWGQQPARQKVGMYFMPRYGLGHGQADSFARQRLSQHSACGLRVEWELGDLDSIVAVGGMHLHSAAAPGPWSMELLVRAAPYYTTQPGHICPTSR